MKYNKKYSLIFTLLFLMISSNALAGLSPKKASKQTWYSISTKNVTVITDVSEKQAIELAQNLERFRSFYEIISNTKLDDSIRPVKMFATKRSLTYDLFREWLGIGRNTGGFFSDTVNGNYSVLRINSSSKNKLSTLFHEYTHYLSSNLSSVNSPYWYSEGSAVYMGKIEFKDDRTILYGKPDFYHLNNIRNMSWMPLNELLNTSYVNSKKRKKRYRIYSQGWLLVHYLNSTNELILQKNKFLKLINDGVQPEEAIEQSTGQSFKDFERKLRKYSRKKKYSYSIITLKDFITLDNNEIEVKKLTADEVVFHIGEFALQNGAGFDKARPFLEKAISLNPNNADALAGLANTYLGVDDEKMASLISAAKKIEPNNPWVATISGHLNFRKYRNEKDKERKKNYRLQSVRDYNLAINSGDVNVEAIFSASRIYSSEKKYEKALELAIYAFALAPSNHDIRVELIRLFLANQEVDKAEIIYNKVMNNHHASEKFIAIFEKWYEEQVNDWAKYYQK